MPRISPIVSLSDVERERLEAWVSAHGTPQQVALRCRIVLAAAAGQTNLTISQESGINPKTVALWRDRFVEAGPEGLWEIAAGRGRKPTYSAAKIKTIVQATLLDQAQGDDSVELPADGASAGCEQVHGQQHLAQPST